MLKLTNSNAYITNVIHKFYSLPKASQLTAYSLMSKPEKNFSTFEV